MRPWRTFNWIWFIGNIQMCALYELKILFAYVLALRGWFWVYFQMLILCFYTLCMLRFFVDLTNTILVAPYSAFTFIKNLLVMVFLAMQEVLYVFPPPYFMSIYINICASTKTLKKNTEQFESSVDASFLFLEIHIPKNDILTAHINSYNCLFFWRLLRKHLTMKLSLESFKKIDNINKFYFNFKRELASA